MEQRHSGAQLRMNRGFWQGFRCGFEFWVWVELRTQMRMQNHLAVRRLDKCRRSHARAGLGNDVNAACRMPHGDKGMPTEGGRGKKSNSPNNIPSAAERTIEMQMEVMGWAKGGGLALMQKQKMEPMHSSSPWPLRCRYPLTPWTRDQSQALRLKNFDLHKLQQPNEA